MAPVQFRILAAVMEQAGYTCDHRHLGIARLHQGFSQQVDVVGGPAASAGLDDLERFLASQDCEVNLPGLMGFVGASSASAARSARRSRATASISLMRFSWFTRVALGS